MPLANTEWAFRTMIVPTDYQQLAQDVASAVGGLAGEDMFITGLSGDGSDPATNYVSTGQIGADFAALLPLDTYTTEIDPQTDQPVVIHTHKDGNPAAVAALANQAGLPVTVQQVTDLFNASDITEQDPFVAFARINLKLVHKPFSES